MLVAFLLWQNWNLNAQAPQHGNQVIWGAVTQDTGGNAITVDGYRVYRGTVAGQTTTLVNTTTTLSYFDTAVTAGTRYFYALTAFKGQFESSKSSEISAVAIGDPKAPAGASVTAE